MLVLELQPEGHAADLTHPGGPAGHPPAQRHGFHPRSRFIWRFLHLHPEILIQWVWDRAKKFAFVNITQETIIHGFWVLLAQVTTMFMHCCEVSHYILYTKCGLVIIPHSCTLQPLISFTFLIKSDKRQKGNKKILWNFTDDSSMSKELSVYYECIREHIGS